MKNDWNTKRQKTNDLIERAKKTYLSICILIVNIGILLAIQPGTIAGVAVATAAIWIR